MMDFKDGKREKNDNKNRAYRHSYEFFLSCDKNFYRYGLKLGRSDIRRCK